MDVIPSEIFRGHLDTIILLSLVNEDKHTNQIREEIEERSDGKFELKQGTFYSCLQRIVKQGYVTEYRATSPDDGVRRKFYQLTEKGKSYIDDNKDKWEISRSVVNVLLETPEKAKPVKQSEPDKPVKQKAEQPEAFDIDKALKDFLNSDDKTADVVSNETKNLNFTESVSDNQKREETKLTVPENDDNVKIISFSDITAKSDNEDKSKVSSEENHIATTPAPDEKHKEKPVVRQADSPELYDLFTLVGFDADKQSMKSSNESETPIIKSQDKPLDNTDNLNNSVKESTQTETLNSAIKTEEKQSEEQPNLVQKPRNVSEFPTKADAKIPSFEPTYNEDEDDYYNGETTVTHDYKEVLEKIFRQPNAKKQPPKEEQREMVYVKGTDIKSYFDDDKYREPPVKEYRSEPRNETHIQPALQATQPKKNDNKQPVHGKNERKQDPEVPVIKSDGYDFSDIQTLAKMEGFKVNVSSGLTKRRVNSILINKLVTVSSWMFFAFVLVEVALLAYFTADAAKLTKAPYVTFACIVALFPIISLIVYFIEPKRKVASIPTMKSVIELCIVIMLNLVLITIVFSILAEVDFSNTAQLLKYVLYPSVVILNVPVYFIIKYLNLENSRFYE